MGVQLEKISASASIVKLNDREILFSYNTPVAVRILETGETFKTTTHWSNTTGGHIGKFLMPHETAKGVSQEEIERLTKEK